MLNTDLHIHSIHSGHAYGTLYEIVEEAKSKELEVVGISDHGPAMAGSAPETHFFMGPRLPEFDVEVLWGCEANVLNVSGDTDLPDEKVNTLDYASVALHPYCGYEDKGRERNTEALIKAMDTPTIKFLSHPTHQHFPVNLEKLVESAVDEGIWLEINLSHLRSNADRIKEMVELAKTRGGRFIVNSDAHFLEEIGDDSPLEGIDLGLNDGDLINNQITRENVHDFLDE